MRIWLSPREQMLVRRVYNPNVFLNPCIGKGQALLHVHLALLFDPSVLELGALSETLNPNFTPPPGSREVGDLEEIVRTPSRQRGDRLSAGAPRIRESPSTPRTASKSSSTLSSSDRCLGSPSRFCDLSGSSQGDRRWTARLSTANPGSSRQALPYISPHHTRPGRLEEILRLAFSRRTCLTKDPEAAPSMRQLPDSSRRDL